MQGYTSEELEALKQAILNALDEIEDVKSHIEDVDVCESSYTNLKVTLILDSDVCIRFDDLAKIAKKVEETGLGSTFVVDGKPFPLDFMVTIIPDKTWLELWF